MKSFTFLLVIFGGIVGKLQASILMSSTNVSATESDSDSNNELLLKSMTGMSDIMNMDTVLGTNGLKAASGKDKDKKKKKKKETSSSSDDDARRRSRHTSRGSASGRNNNEPVMRQQEVRRQENTEIRHDDGSITVRGPITRKPLIFPN